MSCVATTHDRTVKKTVTLWVFCDRNDRWHAGGDPDPSSVIETSFRISGWETGNGWCHIEIDDAETREITERSIRLAGRTLSLTVFEEGRTEARARNLPFVAGLDIPQ